MEKKDRGHKRDRKTDMLQVFIAGTGWLGPNFPRLLGVLWKPRDSGGGQIF